MGSSCHSDANKYIICRWWPACRLVIGLKISTIHATNNIAWKRGLIVMQKAVMQIIITINHWLTQSGRCAAIEHDNNTTQTKHKQTIQCKLNICESLPCRAPERKVRRSVRSCLDSAPELLRVIFYEIMAARTQEIAICSIKEVASFWTRY